MTGIVSFKSDQRGSVAIIFGVSILAIVGVAALAVDFARAYSEKSALQRATDAAALAGASLQEGDTERRITIATAQFVANYKSKTGSSATPVVEISGNRVLVSASARVPMTLARVIGFETMDVPAVSEANTGQGQVARACMLALNRSAIQGLDLDGTARLIADNCWVWSNAETAESIKAIGSSRGVAAGFCAVGGAWNPDLFSPAPKINCPAIADPFANLAAPPVGGCTATGLVLQAGTHTLTPGTYCGGIRITTGANVTLQAGIYTIVDGKLEVGSGAAMSGAEVAFYFTGTRTDVLVGLDIQGGASAVFSAPTGGDLAGFVFVQDRNTLPGAISTIIGGGRLKIDGMLYMPTWIVRVQGNGVMFDEAVSWTMIADRFHVGGTGDIHVRANTTAAGLPNNTPQSGSVMAHLTK
jgi:Flp pilus assembly protein TadG